MTYHRKLEIDLNEKAFHLSNLSAGGKKITFYFVVDVARGFVSCSMCHHGNMLHDKSVALNAYVSLAKIA